MGYNRPKYATFSEVKEERFMDAMGFCGRGGGGGYGGCVLVLLQGVAIISAFPNLLTGDDISLLVNAGRITSEDAKRIVEGQATPEELAQLKVDVLKLNSSSNAAPASQIQQQQQPQQLQQRPQKQQEPQPGWPKARLRFFESTGCDVNPCRNGGVCTTKDNISKEAISCICPQGYYGEFCDYDSPECELEPCLHNGECQRSHSNLRGYTCLCTTGFMGDNCEVTLRTDTTSVSPQSVAQPTSKSVLLRPVVLIIFLSLLFFILGMAFVATVEADRKVLTERYRVLISVGYRVEYPRIEFSRLAAIRIRYLSCCICNMLPCCTCGVYPDDDDELPLPPNMRGVDPCAQLRSIVEAATLQYAPSRHQSQLSLYGRGGGMVEEGEAGRRGYP